MKCQSALLPATLFLASLICGTSCKSTGDKQDGNGTGPVAESEKDRVKRTAAETAFYAECAELGAKGGTVTGKDGWLFSAGELLQLSRVAKTGTATGCIADYAQQLRSRGIDLIVVPVPPKVLVYPDKLACSSKIPLKSRQPARLDSPLKAAMDELSSRKVTVVDILPALLAHRDGKSGTAFPKTSSTWSPVGVQLAAKEIAAAVSASKAGGRGTVTGITAEPITVTFTGGLGIGEPNMKPETFQTSKIGRISGGKVRSLAFDTSGGSLLVMGDSNILAWRETNNPQGSLPAFCSVAEQLAAELQLIPDVLSSTSDGRNAPRLRILRERTNGNGMLGSTKAIVWIIPALELASPNWQRVPLELEFSLESPDLLLR